MGANKSKDDVNLSEQGSPEIDTNDTSKSTGKALNLQYVDFDDVFLYLGPYGRYQLFQLFLQFVCYMGLAFAILHGIFAGKYVDFHCSRKSIDVDDQLLSSNQTVKFTHCDVEIIDNVTSRVLHKETCVKREYDGGDKFISYIAEWDLVCNKEVLGQLPQILLILGQAFGASLLPRFGDWFGRKKLQFACFLAIFALMLLSAFVQQFEFFLVLRFLIGATIQGGSVAGSTLMLEMVHKDARSLMNCTFTVAWMVGMQLTGLIGYFLQDADWRTLQITYALACGLPSLICLPFVNESLWWLAVNSRTEETELILQKCCRWNNKSYETLLDKIANNFVKDNQTQNLMNGAETKVDTLDSHHKGNQFRLTDLFKIKHLRIITLSMCFLWSVTALTYYGILLMSTSLSGEPHVNYALTGVVEIPAAVLSYFLLKYVNRRPYLITLSLSSATSLLLAVLIANVAPSTNASRIVQMCLTLLGQFCIFQKFNTIWLYTPELFPTNIRNLGLGLTSSTARVASSFSPLFTILARKVPWAPGALFGSGCLVSAFLMTMLPETRLVTLPNTRQDIDDMSRKKSGKIYRIVEGNDDKVDGGGDRIKTQEKGV